MGITISIIDPYQTTSKRESKQVFFPGSLVGMDLAGFEFRQAVSAQDLAPGPSRLKTFWPWSQTMPNMMQQPNEDEKVRVKKWSTDALWQQKSWRLKAITVLCRHFKHCSFVVLRLA